MVTFHDLVLSIKQSVQWHAWYWKDSKVALAWPIFTTTGPDKGEGTATVVHTILETKKNTLLKYLVKHINTKYTI